MWKNININKQNIKAETSKSILIAMPHKSDYDGYQFWHPSKLVREGRNSNSVSIGYTEDFTFRLKKYGKDNKILDEDEISASDFEEAFGIMDENIIAKQPENEYETHKPDILEPVKTKVLDELKDE